MAVASIFDFCFSRDVRRSRHLLKVSSPTKLKISSMLSSSRASSKALMRLAIFVDFEDFCRLSEKSRLGVKF